MAGPTEKMRQFHDIIDYVNLREFGKKKSLDNPLINELLKPHDGISDTMKTQLNDLFTEEQRLWILDKFKAASEIIPLDIMNDRGYDKFLKVVFGTVLYKLRHCSKDDPNLGNHAFEALQKGYYFGITYPLVDDIMDTSHLLSDDQKDSIMETIIHSLSRGGIEDAKLPSLAIVHELKRLFREFTLIVPQENHPEIYDVLQVLTIAQWVDQQRNLDDKHDKESLFISVLLKAAYARIVPSYLVGHINDELIDHHYATGLINQWSDDICDLLEDTKNNTATTFTSYLHTPETFPSSRKPLELYLGLIYYLFDDPRHRELLLKRMIQALGKLASQTTESNLIEYLNKLGLEQSPRLLSLILKMIKNSEPIHYEQSVFQKASKIVLKHVGYVPQQQSFHQYLEQQRGFLEPHLQIPNVGSQNLEEAMNYSLNGSGKRMRPILLFMLSQEFGIKKDHILPCAKAIEYFHTASLILDDLPAQDNAKMRRGKPTNHIAFKESTSQLAVISLIAEANALIGSMDKDFDPALICTVIRYMSETIGRRGLSKGQVLDLNGSNSLSLEQLHEKAYLKTGLAIEASMVIPALLSKQEPETIALLKQFAYDLGLIFQIKDDLLAVLGSQEITGKDKDLDNKNGISTYVSLLGIDGAEKILKDIHNKLLNDLRKFPFKTPYFQDIINWAATRDN